MSAHFIRKPLAMANGGRHPELPDWTTMKTPPNQSLELQELEQKLDLLIEQYNAVKNENNSLKIRQEVLVKEKAKLLEKTTQARIRVEAMIARLKAMEQGS